MAPSEPLPWPGHWCGAMAGLGVEEKTRNSRAFVFRDDGVARDVAGGCREEGCRGGFIRRWRCKGIEEQKRQCTTPPAIRGVRGIPSLLERGHRERCAFKGEPGSTQGKEMEGGFYKSQDIEDGRQRAPYVVGDSSHSRFFQGRGSTSRDVGDCGARIGSWTVGQKAGSVPEGQSWPYLEAVEVQ